MTTSAETDIHSGAVSCTQEQQSRPTNVTSTSSKFRLSKKGYKLCIRLELAVLCVLIVVVWGLLAIPVFIFHLSETNETELSNITEVVRDLVIGVQQNDNTDSCQYNCSNDFYCREGVVCVPSCNWKEIPKDSSDLTDIFITLLLVASVIVGIFVLIISCIYKKRMLTFPSVLVIYHNITWLIIGLITLISLVNRNTLFCSTGDLIESILSSTGWCVFSGVIFYYCLLQLIIWWFCHVSVLFWKIKFPLQARYFGKSNKVHYVHIACVLLSLLVPLIPILITIGNNLDDNLVGTAGFTMTRFPPLLCTSIDSNVTFYAFVLPLILTMDIGFTLLLLMVWIVHKQSVGLNANQNRYPFKIGTAEKKLIVIIIYYVILAVMALTTFTVFSRSLPLFIQRLFEFFVCEKNGSVPGVTCDQTGFQELIYPIPSTIAYVLLAINPWLNLIFAVNVKELKEKLYSYVQRTKNLLLNSSNNSPNNTMQPVTASG